MCRFLETREFIQAPEFKKIASYENPSDVAELNWSIKCKKEKSNR
jgi:hypothetical protein